MCFFSSSPISKQWNLFLDVLIPSFLIYQGVDIDSTICCKRINLCRGVSKHFSNSSQINEDLDVFIVPQKDSLLQQLMISTIHPDGVGEIPIYLNLICQHPSSFGSPITTVDMQRCLFLLIFLFVAYRWN